VAEAAADALDLRRALPPGWARDPAAAAEAVGAVLATFACWASSVDAARVGDELATGFWANRRPLLDGQLAQLVGLEQLDDQSVLRRRPGTVCRPRLGGDRLELLLGDRSLSLPAALDVAVGRLLDGPVRLRELADLLDESSRLVLARRLVREGLLVVDGGTDRTGSAQP